MASQQQGSYASFVWGATLGRCCVRLLATSEAKLRAEAFTPSALLAWSRRSSRCLAEMARIALHHMTAIRQRFNRILD